MTVHILVYCAQYYRADDEGSEETMDTESQQRSTLSNEVYKQVHVFLLTAVTQ